MIEHFVGVGDWLQQRLANLENGVVIEERDFDNFEAIQDFIEAKDLTRKTPAIYYQAFPKESAAKFLSILEEELRFKLGNQKLYADASLPEIITAAELKMVIIDQSYLHPQETTRELVLWLNHHDVCLVLVGLRSQIDRTQILSDAAITQVYQTTANNCANALPVSC